MQFIYMGKQKWVTAIKAKEGAELAGDRIGQRNANVNPVKGFEDSTINFEYIVRRQCTTEITDQEFANIMKHAPAMIKKTKEGI